MFRTRHAEDVGAIAKCSYPFDTLKFQPSTQAQSQAKPGDKTPAKKRDDLIHEVRMELLNKNTTTHTMELRYLYEAEIQMLKLYFSNPKPGASYTMHI
jgi:hypothetical protein